MQKFLEFLKKYKFIIMLASSTLFMFLSGYVWWFWIVGAVINFAFYATCSITEMLCATMYYGLFSGIGVFFIVSILEMQITLIAKYIIDVIKKRKKVYVLPLVLTFVIIVIFASIHYSVDVEGFFQGSILIAFLLSSYLIFIYWKEINVSECFKYLIIGMVVSLVLSLISIKLPGYGYSRLINLPNGIIWGNRLNLFTLNPNHLAMYCTFAIAFYVTRVANGKGNEWVNFISILIPVIFGIFTLSKAFLLLLILLMIYLFVFIIVRYKKKSTYVIIPAAIFAAIVCAIFNKQVWEILKRFFYSSGDTKSIIDYIFTGRVGIWEDYLNNIRSSVLKLLFGFGLFNTKVIDIGPHSVYVFLLYRFGFIGIIMLGVLVWSYLKCKQTKFRPTLKNALLLLTYLILGIEELVLNDRFLYFFFFATILIAQSVENPLYLVKTNFDYLADKMVNKIKLKFGKKKLASENEIEYNTTVDVSDNSKVVESTDEPKEDNKKTKNKNKQSDKIKNEN